MRTMSQETDKEREGDFPVNVSHAADRNEQNIEIFAVIFFFGYF